jgi:hypothetical protein
MMNTIRYSFWIFEIPAFATKRAATVGHTFLQVCPGLSLSNFLRRCMV